MRFLVAADGVTAAWVHALEISDAYAGYTDCTDMNDEEFHAFVVKAQGR
jgi:hypothetical protein